VKKKSPPYAILVAAVVGILGIFLLFKWKQQMDINNQNTLDAKTKELQQEIDDLKTKQAQPVVTTDTNMRKVYYATQPIDAGAKISPAFYEEKLTPNDVLPDAYGDGSDVVGFYAIRPIEKGDPLTPHNVDKTLPYLSERIPAGMRAVALPIFNADLNNTGGFVVDGDIVDLLYTPTVKDSDGEEGMVNTQTILQKVQVLYVPGPQTRSDMTAGVMPAPTPGEPISVTFLVTPEEAQMLVHLVQEKYGHINMILRGRNDKDEEKLKPYTITSLDDFRKAQKQMDKSFDRVAELQKELEAAEQKVKDQAAAQGNTNETTHPTPPSP
jgi:Flp pilus assembly protein CpaB